MMINIHKQRKNTTYETFAPVNIDYHTIKDKMIKNIFNNGTETYIKATDEQNASPVNEFSTPGYLTMMFPTDFINGTADITAGKN